MRAEDILRRAGLALISVFIAVTVNFVLFRAIPGSAVDALRCSSCSPQFAAALRRSLGLDQSLPHQYWLYLRDLAQGDLGHSIVSQKSVTSVIWDALGNTLPMVLMGTVVAVVVGVAIALLAAWRSDRASDRAGIWSALALSSTPPQIVGMLMVMYVATAVGLPSSGVRSSTLDLFGEASWWSVFTDRLQHMILPALTLALTTYGSYAYILRASLREELAQDYVLTARAKGLTDWRVIRRHVAPNAALPTVTLIALSLGFAVGGVIAIELVFSYPGIGLATTTAVAQRDYPVLQGLFLVFTVGVVLCNFLADIVHAQLDPRIRA